MDQSLRQFIDEHGKDDTTKLLLARKKWPDIDMDLAVNTIEGRKRIASKVPVWGERSDFIYPTRLCTEQCSSVATATYKASIAHRMGWKKIADLTGGLGVDSWYLAQEAEQVLHNEADPILAKGVRENFEAAGSMNIDFRSMMVAPGNVSKVLDGFSPDVVFMDPARRSESGKKVFLIEDCQPDVLGLKDEIFGICRWIFLKLSPMADISMAVNRLGNVTEVHAVGSEGECKELLIVMDREHESGTYRLFVHDSGKTLELDQDMEKTAEPALSQKKDLSGTILFEPGKALGKAGVANSLCVRFGIEKAGKFTNLYLFGNMVPDASDGIAGLADFGKTYLIKEMLPLDKRSMKDLGERLGWADVTARNIPMTSEELGKKMGLSPKKAGSGIVPHVFGVKMDWKDAPSENMLIATERLNINNLI